MNCEVCGKRIEFGCTVTRDCDGCLKAYLELRSAAAEMGAKLPELSAWAIKRGVELGLLPASS